jgi:polyhydroxyalkanoate synthase subunit PhaC
LEIWTPFWNWPLATMEIWRRALEPLAAPDVDDAAPHWPTPCRLLLDLPALRLWDFSTGDSTATPALLVAPYALHDARLVDLAPGHSLVAALLPQTPRVYLAEWKSATAATQHYGLDDLLAAFNVAVDEIGALLDLVGLCQGGWLSLLYAGRFPGKVRRLVVAGAPVDVEAEPSALSACIEQTSDADIRRLIDSGGGRVRGAHMGPLWPREQNREQRLVESLEIEPPFDSLRMTIAAFDEWDRRHLDLPGPYYRQVFTWLYRENRLARGGFPALGRLIDLRALRQPLYLLIGERDAIAPPAQALAAARLVSGPVETARAPCGHLALFLGRRTLDHEWPRIAQWLSRSGAAA